MPRPLALASMLRPRPSPFLLLTGEAACTDHGLQPLSVTGACAAAPGVFDVGRRVEDGMVNLATDPSFATLTAGEWASAEAGVSVVAQSGFVVSGSQGARLTATGGAGWHYAAVRPNVAITSADVVTLSCHAKQTGLGGNDRYLLLVDRGDASTHYGQFDVTTGALVSSQGLTASGSIALAGGGYRCWITYTAGSTYASTTVGVGPGNGSGGSYTPGGTAESVDVDGFVCSKGAGVTSYADGSLGTGYAWTGTPHASTSTRTATTLRAPAPFPAREGGGAAWLRPAWSGSSEAEHVVWHASDGAGTELRLRHVSAQWRLEAVGRGVTASAVLAATHADGEPVAIPVAWGGARLTLRVGSLVAHADRVGAIGVETVRGMTIGRRADTAGGYLDGVLDSMAVVPWTLHAATLESLCRRGSRLGWRDLGRDVHG